MSHIIQLYKWLIFFFYEYLTPQCFSISDATLCLFRPRDFRP